LKPGDDLNSRTFKWFSGPYLCFGRDFRGIAWVSQVRVVLLVIDARRRGTAYRPSLPFIDFHLAPWLSLIRLAVDTSPDSGDCKMPQVSRMESPKMNRCFKGACNFFTVAIPVPMMMHHELENPSVQGCRRPIPGLDYCNYALANHPSPPSCACRSHGIRFL
jgi:hypothetical protein